MRLTDEEKAKMLCHLCGKKVRRWQSSGGGWRALGSTPKAADVIWHSKCLGKQAARGPGA
jgi:hypothetical protein